MNYKSYSDLVTDIKENISHLQGKGFDLVVGIPRSGMIPAYIIASFLNIHCTDRNSFLLNIPLQKGLTKKLPAGLKFPSEAKKILLVDDSINSGNSLKKILSDFSVNKQKVITLAIYSSLKKRDDVDIFFKYLSYPRVFEWNIFHHEVLANASVDIDGVLCIDPTNEENDDGTKYRYFLNKTKPYILPTLKIHSLVTNRLEKYRNETENWLNKWGIQYDNLIMLDLPTKEERIRLKIRAKHKAEYYKKSKTQLFIESDPIQAQEILSLSSKDVYCVESNDYYCPKVSQIIKNNPVGLVDLIPNAIINPLYSLYLYVKTSILR